MTRLGSLRGFAASAVVASEALPAPAPHVSGAALRARATPPGQILAIACAGIVLANLDLFIVNVALPDISRDFGGPSLERLSWILNGYAIVYAALLVFFGRLAERFRRNASFLLGVAIFTIASGACAIAGSVEALILFRIAQAVGAALLTPTSLGLILASYPPDRRGGAVRTWTAVGGFAAALGPLVGGLLVTASWRWVFLVNLPIGAAALALGWLKLPDIAGHDVAPPDPFAAALVTLGVAALTFGIVKLGGWGWSSSGVWASFAAASIFLASFVAHCLRSRDPFVDPALFRIPAFSGAALAMAPYAAAFGAMLLSIVLWEQAAWGWTGLQIGLALAPGPLMVPVTSLLLAGRLIARFGAAGVVALGIVAFSLSIVLFATQTGLHPDPAPLLARTMLMGFAVGLTLPTLMGVSAASLPPSSFATGSGVINMIRQTAMAVGVALVIAFIGSPQSATGRLHAFQQAWWAMAAIAAAGLLPLPLLFRRKG